MPKGSPELTQARQEEIVNACEQLYQTMSFKEITIKEIGQRISCTRTSIYNYFQTKEEIFLALLQREYELWIADLEGLLAEHEALDREDFAEALSRTLERRAQLLKLMSMNHFDMEENSRMERLVEFKKVYGRSIQTVRRCLDRFCPAMTEGRKQAFLYAFFPFMYGVYPYAVVTEKQREAMERADVGFVYHSIYEITCACVKKLLEQ